MEAELLPLEELKIAVGEATAWLVLPRRVEKGNLQAARYQVTAVDPDAHTITVSESLLLDEADGAGYQIYYARPNTIPLASAVVNNAGALFSESELLGMAKLLVDNGSIGYSLHDVELQINALLLTKYESGASVASLYYNDPRTWDSDARLVKYGAGCWGHFQVNVAAPYVPHILSTAERAALKDGIDELGNVTEGVSEQNEFQKTIPLAGGKGLNDLFSVSNSVKSRLVTPMTEYLANEEIATADGLMAAAGLVGADEDEAFAVRHEGSQYLFDVNFHEEATLSVPLKLDILPEQWGLSLGVSTSLDVFAALDFQFTFGIDLAQLDNPSDAFFIQVRDLKMSANVDVADLDAAIRFGFLDAGIQDGSVEAVRRTECGFSGSEQ